MDPTGIIAIIGAIGLFFQQITNTKETKRQLEETRVRLVDVERAQADCLKRDQQREIELEALKTENKTVTHFEDFITAGRNSDLKKILIEIAGVKALFDPKKKRITHIEKPPSEASETIGDK